MTSSSRSRRGAVNAARMHPVGGPDAAPRGGESIGTVVLTPGSYAAFCHVKRPALALQLAKAR
jgi:hypothetical protein